MGVEDEVTCANLLNDPRLLSCSHSFCLACLKSLPLPLSCPSCRKTTPADKGIEALAKNHPLANIADALRKKHKAHKPTEIVESEIRELILSDKPALDHLAAQRKFHSKYVATLMLLLDNKVALPATNKPRILAASWALRNYELPELLFSKYEFDVPDVVRAVQIMDNQRVVDTLSKRLERLRANKARVSAVAKARGEMNNARDLECCGTLSGAARRHIKQFVKHIPAERLEFFLLNFPTKPWQTLADLLHLAPRDFALPWFLACVYGAEPPVTEGGLLAACMRLTLDNVDATLDAHQVPYSFLRKKLPPSSLSAQTRGKIVAQTPLHYLLWYYEELQCPTLDEAICERFKAGDDPALAFGKLVELLITIVKPNSPTREYLIPYAESVRSAIKLAIPSPVLIIGDASSSMNVAVRTATIIAGFVASLCPPGEAELRFFNSGLLPAPYVPKNLKEILDVASKVKAAGMTTNAAGLHDKYMAKEVYKTILMVTDEEENGTVRVDGVAHNFGQLYQRYCAEVYPASLTFVSFLSQHDSGRMVQQLRRAHVDVEQLRFDPRRPDLTRLDGLVGMLASAGESFAKMVDDTTKKATPLSDNNDDSAAVTSSSSSNNNKK